MDRISRGYENMLLLVTVVAVGLLLGGCEGAHMSPPFEKFVPVEIDTEGRELFVFHPEFSEDEDFRTGLALLLWNYGHDFMSKDGSIYVRKRMCRPISCVWSYPTLSDELEYRANLTEKARAIGREYRQKMQSLPWRPDCVGQIPKYPRGAAPTVQP